MNLCGCNNILCILCIILLLSGCGCGNQNCGCGNQNCGCGGNQNCGCID